jgi:hypothetical protein
MRQYLVLFLLFISYAVYSQASLDLIDLQKIPQKKIRTYIDLQKSHNVHFFKDVKPTFTKGQDKSPYREVEKKYLIKERINKVWDIYCSTSPALSWNGKIISFGVLFSKGADNVMYRNESYAGADTGQVVYVNLKLLGGLYNLAVAFEIVDIDNVNKEIVFSYIEGGKSSGEQLIQFVDTKEGYTEIIHTTFFKSNSKFRDKFLYPPFHFKAIDEFHKNMLNVIFNDKAKLVSL